PFRPLRCRHGIYRISGRGLSPCRGVTIADLALTLTSPTRRLPSEKARAGNHVMTSSARRKGLATILIALTLGGDIAERSVIAAEPGKLVAPGRLVVAGRRLSCGMTSTLVRDFEGLALSSPRIMLHLHAIQR